MELDRFKDYDKEIRKAVLHFERVSKAGAIQYIDIDEMETVIDFYLESNDVESVQKAVSYAERLFPNSNEIKLRRAHMYSVQGNPQGALSLLKEILRREPGNTDAEYAMGIVYGMLGQSQRAIQYYQLASADGCELGLLYGNMADEYYKLEQYDKAVAYYKKAIAENPDEERSMYNLLSIYDEQNRIDDIVDYFRQQTKKHPYSVCAWMAYGHACLRLDLYEQAIEAYEYAIVIDKTFVQAYFCLCDAYHSAGNNAKAVAVLHECLDYSEDKSWIYFSIGMIYMESLNIASAIVYFRKTVQDDPYYGDAWQMLGQCYMRDGDLYTALEMSERAVSVNPQSTLYMRQAAGLYDQIGDTEKADSLYQYTLHLDGALDDCWLDYSDFLIRHERYDDAINILDKGIAKAIFQHEFNVRLAVCYFKTGRRNYLFNALRACMADSEYSEQELFTLCPEMQSDPDVVAIVSSN